MALEKKYIFRNILLKTNLNVSFSSFFSIKNLRKKTVGSEKKLGAHVHEEKQISESCQIEPNFDCISVRKKIRFSSD